MKITTVELGEHVAVTAVYRAQETLVYHRSGEGLEQVDHAVQPVTSDLRKIWFDYRRRHSGDA